MEDKFTDKIKGQLQEYRIEPPEMAWTTIDAILNEEKATPVIFWKRWASIVAILALPIVIGIILFLSKPETQVNYTQIEEKSEIKLEANEKKISKGTKQNKIRIFNRTSEKKKKVYIAQQRNQAILRNDKKATPSSTKKINKTIKRDKKGKTEIENQKQIVTDTELHFRTERDQEEIIARKNNKLQIEISPYTGISSIMPFSDANLITSKMNDFSTTNKAVITYGSNISIQINPKIRIRTGIGVLNIGQKTHNIPLSLSSEIGRSRGNNMISKSKLEAALPTSSLYNNMAFSSIEVKNSHPIHETLSYELQFIEIPLGIEYKWVETSKFNLFSTSGISTLLRNKNNIYINNNEQFAESTNINKASFSANLGLKLNYQLNSNLSVNLEPQVKYLLNTITNNNLKPYTIGVNVGFSWKLFNK